MVVGPDHHIRNGNIILLPYRLAPALQRVSLFLVRGESFHLLVLSFSKWRYREGENSC